MTLSTGDPLRVMTVQTGPWHRIADRVHERTFALKRRP